MTRKIQDVMKLRAILALSIAVVALAGVFRLDRSDCFSGDGLCKLVQSVSLRHNDFKSDVFFYPGSHIDPEYRFYPMQGVYHVVVNGRHTGPYPLVFTALGALYSHVMPYSGFIVAGVVVFLGTVWLFSRLSNDPWIVLLFAFATPLYVMSLDFSENIYAAFTGALGSLLFVRALKEERPSRPGLALSGLVFGLCAFWRVETMLLLPCLATGLIWHYRRALTDGIKAVLAFSGPGAAALLVFFAFNMALYGAPLGPRVAANPMQWDLPTKLQQMQTLLFAGQGGLGFFGYMPAGILLLFLGFRSGQRVSEVFAAALLLFLPLVSFLAPDYGIVNWGPRFLLQGVFPLFAIYWLWHQQCSVRWKRYAMMALFLPSLAFTYTGYGISRAACKQLRQYQTEYRAAQGDVWVFSDMLLVGGIGPAFFDRPIYLARSRPEMQELVRRLVSEKGKRIVYFSPVIPEEFKHMAPPTLLAREDYAGEFAARFKAGAVTQGRFIKSTVFEVP